MDEILNILIPYGYENPTEKQIRNAKKWTMLRNDNAARLSSLIEGLLENAARDLTIIGYKYNCKPEDFQFSQDKNLREEVATLMSDLEDDIMELVQEYSLNETEDKKHRNNILPWLLALHSKNTKNLASTLHERVRQFMYDTEAQIAAMKLASYGQTKAVGRVISTMHSVYSAPEVLAAFNKQSAARYIRTNGVHEGNVGLSSSGAVNIENFGDMTARMAWSRSQYEQAKEDGKNGFIVSRGSTYPCDLCDSKCGFHLINQTEFLPPFHGHCCCYIVFVDKKEEERKLETLKEQRKRIKEESAFLQEEVFENKDVEWEAAISGAGIKEWINQPHKNYREKNEALPNLNDLFKNADYIKPIKDSKGRKDVKNSHIFKTRIAGEDSWIIVHEMVWGEYYIHSITDRNPIK